MFGFRKIKVMPEDSEMMRYSYENLRFASGKVFLYGVFAAPLDLSGLDVLNTSREHVDVADKDSKQFERRLHAALRELNSTVTGKPTTYIHANSGIPLVGSNEFGIMDRGSSMVQLRPLSGCNVGCTFCSVDVDRRLRDFVVEKEYLVAELARLLPLKKCQQLEVIVNPQGEAGYYAPLVELVADIAKLSEVVCVTLYTTGVGITPARMDALMAAGLGKISFSLHALEKDARVASPIYDPQNTMALARRAAKSIKVVLAPVMVQGVNEDAVQQVCRFGRQIGAMVLVQNFVSHKLGKKPAPQRSWEDFFALLASWKQQGILDDPVLEPLPIAASLPKPLRKGDIVDAEIMVAGRLPHEWIAVAKGRSISVMHAKAGPARIRIIRDKDNFYYGEVA